MMFPVFIRDFPDMFHYRKAFAKLLCRPVPFERQGQGRVSTFKSARFKAAEAPEME